MDDFVFDKTKNYELLIVNDVKSASFSSYGLINTETQQLKFIY